MQKASFFMQDTPEFLREERRLGSIFMNAR